MDEILLLIHNILTQLIYNTVNSYHTLYGKFKPSFLIPNSIQNLPVVNIEIVAKYHHNVFDQYKT